MPFFTRGPVVVVARPIFGMSVVTGGSAPFFVRPNFGGSVVGRAPFFVRAGSFGGSVVTFTDAALALIDDTPPPIAKTPISVATVAMRAVRDEIFMWNPRSKND